MRARARLCGPAAGALDLQGQLPSLEQLSFHVHQGWLNMPHLELPKLISSLKLSSNSSRSRLIAAEERTALWRRLAADCGAICNVTDGAASATVPGLFAPDVTASGRPMAAALGGAFHRELDPVLRRTVRKPTDCRRIWGHRLYEPRGSERPVASSPRPASRGQSKIGWPSTRALWDAFSFHGKVQVDVRLQIAPYVGGMAQNQAVARASRRRVWSADFINDLSAKCAAGTLAGEFGQQHVERAAEALHQIGSHVRGQQLLVVSSGEPPWLEACALAEGAASVTRIGPGLVTSLHPNVTVLTPEEAEALVAAGRMPLFDAAASYLALQHEGFGRHGELLSPLADLQLMARVWCITKPLALMLLSVPVGADFVHWKRHRVYGRKMLPHLLANWHARVLRSERQGMRTMSPPLLLLQRLDPQPTHGPNATSTNAGGPYR